MVEPTNKEIQILFIFKIWWTQQYIWQRLVTRLWTYAWHKCFHPCNIKSDLWYHLFIKCDIFKGNVNFPPRGTPSGISKHYGEHHNMSIISQSENNSSWIMHLQIEQELFGSLLLAENNQYQYNKFKKTPQVKNSQENLTG